MVALQLVIVLELCLPLCCQLQSNAELVYMTLAEIEAVLYNLTMQFKYFGDWSVFLKFHDSKEAMITTLKLYLINIG